MLCRAKIWLEQSQSFPEPCLFLPEIFLRCIWYPLDDNHCQDFFLELTRGLLPASCRSLSGCFSFASLEWLPLTCHLKLSFLPTKLWRGDWSVHTPATGSTLNSSVSRLSWPGVFLFLRDRITLSVSSLMAVQCLCRVLPLPLECQLLLHALVCSAPYWHTLLTRRLALLLF